jgi:F-type H+-transporting ATPase subunit delta
LYEIPLSDKEKAIEKIYGPLKLPYYTDFLKLLTKKHRIASFEIISREFGELVCEKLGIIEGIIYSVEKLPAAKIHTVEDAFAKKFGKKVELKNVIEPGLIGGVKVALDGKVYDGSLRNRLMGLENTLMKSGGSR